MASTSWLCLAGVEISNDCRTTQYMREGLKPHTTTVYNCCCPDLSQMLGDGTTYNLPAIDNAPWFDPSEPESADFAGFLITSIDGLDNARMVRPVVDRTTDGAVIGRRRYAPRTIVVRGLLAGADCCATEYGLRWLSSALAGSLSCSTGAGCSGDDLTYLACCPEACDDGPEFDSYLDCLTPHIRTLRDVALTDGPEVIGRIGGACSCCATSCPMLEVQFTLTAGRPHAFRESVNVVTGATWDPDGEGECVTWVVGDDCVDPDECPEADPCPLDPNCPPAVVPDLPMISNPCVCDPLVRNRMCIDIPAGSAPIWADAVVRLTIYAGSNDLRGIRIRFYPNPLNREIDELDACGFCSEVNVSFLPASSTLVIDGSRRSVTVTCPGRAETPAGSIVYGPDGGPYEYPIIECGIPYIMCVEADAATIAPDASVTVDTIVREV